MGKILIETNNLLKIYGERTITNNISTTIYDKDFTVIMGSSGSGKSTLLYLLSGLENPTSGSVFYDQKDIVTFKENETASFRRKTVGFIFQAMHLVPTINILENLMVPGGLVTRDHRRLKEHAIGLLHKLKVEQHANKFPSQLSGGEQQRVAIARAMINQPKVLFADEPTGALNSKQSENVLDLLSKLHNEGQSIVMVTHDIKAATRATRLLFLKDGSIDGDISLPPYQSDNHRHREETIFNFLKQKGW